MAKLDRILYTAKVHTTGGREGAARSNDGHLQIALSDPGTNGAGTNPEQLLAAGWSACFLSAVKLNAAKKRIALPNDISIDTEIDLGLSQRDYGLAARLTVNLPGVDQATAESLVEASSNTCPYSLATKGNVDVKYNVITTEAANRVAETQYA